MTELTRAQGAMLGVLLLGALAYLVVPTESSTILTSSWYDGIAAGSVVVVWVGIIRHRPRRRTGWILVAAGFSAWVLGDVLYAIETNLLQLPWYPAPSDFLYLAGYGVLAAGLLHMVRSRQGSSDRTALLDACIIATGAAVLAVVTVVGPLAVDTYLSLPQKIVYSGYPIADVLLLAMVIRLWSGSAVTSASHRLLTLAIVLTLTADVIYNIVLLTGTDPPRWLDLLWIGGYIAVAAAASVTSMRTLGELSAEREQPLATRRRLATLTAGLMLPGLALVVDGLNGGGISWEVVGVGIISLSGLVVVRMSGLLETVQVQAIQLAALARSDGLTGAPNRRTWDHELSRACRESRDTGVPLCIAILDLDHFKRYNDQHGHPAGDLVLRESVAAWTEALAGRGLLARYGGEEFTLLLPGHTLEQAMSVVQSLRKVTPSEQTFSAGIAAWEPDTEPGYAVARADEAMYVAKRNGRDRVVVHPGGAADPVDEATLPAFTILLQPLVDVAAGRVLGHEATCRFDDTGADPMTTFRVAHEHGWGDLLEAAAIRVAMEVPGRPEATELFITASVAALDSDRFWLLLPADLRGVVVQLNEAETPLGEEALAAVVRRIRSRGARVALDDLGAGASELTRMAALRPDVIKIDRRLVHGCAGDQGRCAVIGALVAYADVLGVLVCAEGVERSDDLRRLGELGITCMQGFLIGEPAADWRAGTVVALG